MRPPSSCAKPARATIRGLLGLARELDSVNLPTGADEMRALLRRSEASFRGRIHGRARTVYVFCAEEAASGRLVAASMIIGKRGTPVSPHYYLEVDSDERYSHTLENIRPPLPAAASFDGRADRDWRADRDARDPGPSGAPRQTDLIGFGFSTSPDICGASSGG